MKIDPKALIRARHDRGLTRRQAAEILGVSQATLLDWEKGARQPRPGRLVDLAGCYSCHVDDLQVEEAPDAEASMPAELERNRSAGAGRTTYRQAALALDPAAYDLELPSRIAGCPDFYFPDAPRNPAGCGTLDGNCAPCWDREYQGEAPRPGLSPVKPGSEPARPDK